MAVEIKTLPNSQVEITGELDAQIFSVALEKITKKYVDNTEIEGFRKGKAPEKMVIEKIGEANIMEHAAEEALKIEWPKVLEDNKIDAIGPAEFHITKLARGNNLGWKAIVSVLPKFKLPDWTLIAKDVNSKAEETIPEVTEKEVEDTLNYIQKVRTKEGEKTPPLDDAYAKSLGEFSNLDALKDNVKGGIKEEKKVKAKDEHRAKLIGTIADKAEVEVPQIMIDAECHKMVGEMKANVENMGLKWDEYLTHLKKTEGEIKEGYQKDAKRRVLIGMTLSNIAKERKIEAGDSEINDRVEKILKPYSADELKKIDRMRVKDYAKGVIKNEKVLALLENIK
jgi:FKBP-type peptidyl-prolyl cis-trans isomerase (trigger factor)